jgi:hypothetical protein
MTIEKIAILSNSILIIVLVIRLYWTGKTTRSLVFELTKANKEKLYAMQMLEKLIEEQDTQTLEKTDGFLKFVSDSRDWAFSYIEDVQNKLSEFDLKMADIERYYSVYGPDMPGVHIDLLKQVSEAYADLKSVLPKEDGKV